MPFIPAKIPCTTGCSISTNRVDTATRRLVEDPTKELELLYDAKEFSEAVRGQIFLQICSIKIHPFPNRLTVVLPMLFNHVLPICLMIDVCF